MKKIFLAFALLLSLGCAAPAAAQKISVGLTGGLNVSKVNFSKETFSTGNRYGWFIGPKAKLTLPLGFGIDAAAVYNKRRLNLDDKKNSTEDFHSIEIPVNIRYSVGLGSTASVYFATGPQFGFNVGSKKWKMSNFPQTFKTKSRNTSWNIGAGVTLIKHLEVGVGYNIALSKYAEAASSDDYDFKTNTFQVQACYYF